MTDSKVTYSSRPYRDGDENAINSLYQAVTGRARSLEQFKWQWLSAPGGIGEMWLIEAQYPSGETKLIGHHGVMPVRFTYKANDLLFGKTENTMVLPEFRQKILYPRFEKRFAQQYEHRFHALFSTTGPGPAIRQREAQGYTAQKSWIELEHAAWPFGSLAKMLRRVQWHENLVSRSLQAIRPISQPGKGVQVHFLSSDEAKVESVFEDYWKEARQYWGIAPRRDKKDLCWRFWENPYHTHETILLEDRGTVLGVAVVHHVQPLFVRLLDVSFVRPNVEILNRCMEQLMYSIFRHYRCKIISFLMTEDMLTADLNGAFRKHFRSSFIRKLTNANQNAALKMPRKLTASGKGLGLTDGEWAITPIVAEGRV